MKTMALIDQFGFTMQHLGHSLAEVAEYRERSEWIEAHRAGQKAEEYRVQAQNLRKRISAALKDETDNEDEQSATVLEFPNRSSLPKAA